MRAERLVARLAVGAGGAGGLDPLDADAGAEGQGGGVDEGAVAHDEAGAFVAADEGQFGGEGPVAEEGVEVGVADA